MAIIKKLKDGSENVVFPVTHERAVRDNSGTTLETKLQDIASTATSNLAESKSYTDTINSAMDTRVSANSQDIDDLQETSLNILDRLGTLEDHLEDCIEYDVSARNGGQAFTFQEAVALVPEAYRHGGLILKFISNSDSSDNKYVQYRLTKNEWSINTEDWAIADEGVYVENPEFIYVKTDKKNKILWAIRTDGSIYYGAGVPQQVINYIDEKVDKEDGKSLVDSEFAGGISYVENPEFVAVYLDKDERILFGVNTDGNFYFGAGVPKQIVDYIEDRFKGITVEDIKISLESDTTIIQYLNETYGEYVENPEWLEVRIDAEGRIIRGTKLDGTLVENIGIKTPEITLSQEGLDKLAEELDIPLPETIGLYKSPNLPKYGTTNIKTETFYLTAVEGLTSLSQIELIQDFEDTTANASDRMTIYYYYFNNTRLRHYAASKVKERNGEYYAKETVRKVGNAWYYADTLGYNGTNRTKVIEGYTEMYNGSVPETGNYALIETTVIKFTAPCCVGAWTVEDWDFNAVEGTDIGKKYEHYCVCDINFGHYLTKTNAYIGVKHQGNSTQGYRKRNYRYTFYKKNDYGKKEKIKIGELLRLSKFNLKANWIDNTRIKELILYRIFTQIWQNRPITDRYNWDGGANGLYHGVTGNCNGFPITLNVNGEFYGIYNFDIPKDGKNYMIDDEDESTGLFVSGSHNTTNDWGITYPYNISDHYDSEMDSSDFNDYPMIEMAICAWTGFINNRMYKAEDGKGYDLFQCTFRGADGNYYKYNQVTYNDETGKWYHDDVEILSIYVTEMYWDANHNTYHRAFTTEVDNTRYVTATLDPETGRPTSDSVTVTHFDLTDEHIPFDRENITERLDVLGFIDYMICMQLFVMYDNQHNNVLMYSGPEKEKMFPFFYDLDGSIQENREGGTEADIFADGVSLSNDMSLWRNLRDIYWDDMVNRYCELRKTYLSLDYIRSVYNDVVTNIPDSDFENERTKWGSNSRPNSFEDKLSFLTERIQWLDESYFNI